MSVTGPTTISLIESEELPLVKFKTARLLTQTIDATEGDVLYVQDVTPQVYDILDKYRESKGRKYRFRRFYPEQSLLIIIIPTECLEYMHRELNYQIRRRIDDMGLGWLPCGGATYKRQPGGAAGEGDSSGRPCEPQDRAWPTLVIEAGYSQSLEALRRELKWWFSESNHKVKVVLLVKIHPPSRQEITIEMWRERLPERRSGPMTLRALADNSGLSPHLQQTINITRVSDADPLLAESYRVTGGALRLEFADLFDRQPREGEGEGEGEGDIIIQVEGLRSIAAIVGHARHY
ncbi:unnamed protein product [Clonostachys byssicola]|uniref:Uncharacterized protein n=1 Tax=Clonostachys byssicola TaxID=160290 RepID=A0A9N9UW10_9HYPO|nr:unnamed protein product [Clonostachys byssicola]